MWLTFLYNKPFSNYVDFLHGNTLVTILEISRMGVEMNLGYNCILEDVREKVDLIWDGTWNDL